MNIEKILTALQSADDKLAISCAISSVGLRSRIDIVGQVKSDTPGATIGEREPYLREKTVAEFKQELQSFGADYQGNDFLLVLTHELNQAEYELRYFALTQINIAADEVLLLAEKGERVALREHYQEPEIEE